MSLGEKLNNLKTKVKVKVEDFKNLEECKGLLKRLNTTMMVGMDVEGGEGDSARRAITNVARRLPPEDRTEARRYEEELARRKLALRQNVYNYLMKRVGEGDRYASELVKEYYFP
jgi:hypothetical protein